MRGFLLSDFCPGFGARIASHYLCHVTMSVDYQPRAWGDQVVNRSPIDSGGRGPQKSNIDDMNDLTNYAEFILLSAMLNIQERSRNRNQCRIEHQTTERNAEDEQLAVAYDICRRLLGVANNDNLLSLLLMTVEPQKPQNHD